MQAFEDRQSKAETFPDVAGFERHQADARETKTGFAVCPCFGSDHSGVLLRIQILQIASR